RLALYKDTWAKSNQSALHAITLVFHIGLHGSLAFPQVSLPPKLISITANVEGMPTPMLAVTGVTLDQLQKSVKVVSEEFAGDFESLLQKLAGEGDKEKDIDGNDADKDDNKDENTTNHISIPVALKDILINKRTSSASWKLLWASDSLPGGLSI
ncbi:hypothetical protein MJO29_004106, partial [Puccinia striiformis f. sp. tritici]